MRLWAVLTALALTALVVGVTGCGGSNSSAETASAKKRPYPWVKGPSRQFLVPGGDNVVPTSGEEGTPRERAEATAVVAAWLRARAAEDGKRQCSYLSRAYIKNLIADAHSVTKGKVDSCAGALDYFKFENHGNFKDTLGGQIDSLRVGGGIGSTGKPGSLAWAQYHGTDGNDWIVPLEREHGEWKVAKFLPLQSQH